MRKREKNEEELVSLLLPILSPFSHSLSETGQRSLWRRLSIGHILNKRGTGSTYDCKGSRNRLEGQQIHHGQPPASS